MFEKGIMSKVKRDRDILKRKDFTSLFSDAAGLGYETVTFPFMLLSAGIAIAILQLGIERRNICLMTFAKTLRKVWALWC